MKLSNQIILDIHYKNDATELDKYNAVRLVADDAMDIVYDETHKTSFYWGKKENNLFCHIVRKLI